MRSVTLETPVATGGTPAVVPATSTEAWGLRGFLGSVHDRVEAAIAAVPMHTTQRALLLESAKPARARAEQEPLGDPLCTVYLLGLAGRRAPTSEAWTHLGAFLILYILALDLMDDVQDEDLEGTPYEVVSPAIAFNTGLTLLFLAQDELRRAAMGLPALRAEALLGLASRISLRAVVGQHRDLIGVDGATTPDEVLAMQRDKTSSLSLLTEGAAIVADHCESDRAHLRAFGEAFAMFIQVRDDLRDVYGKDVSPDLAGERRTYPIACFYELATDEDRQAFAAAKTNLPDAMPTLRRLLYKSGAVKGAATTLERLRRDMHQHLAAIEAPGAAGRRSLLDVVDGLARSVYQVPDLEVTRGLWAPTGPWHERVRAEQERFCRRMADRGLTAAPPGLRPWARPHWMFVPEANTIFYPDLEALAPDVLGFQAQLLGTFDLEMLRTIMVEQVPVVIAHEMFHFWRHAAGRLTRDHWHEEWVANRCAVAYGQGFAPEAVVRASKLAAQVTSTHDHRLDETALELLVACRREDPERSGYAMDMEAVAVVTMAMIEHIVADQPRLSDELAAWLTG